MAKSTGSILYGVPVPQVLGAGGVEPGYIMYIIHVLPCRS